MGVDVEPMPEALRGGGGGGEAIADEASPKLVARYLDCRLLKGYSDDFAPDRRCFHLRPLGASRNVVPVHLGDLKAVFFVRDFAGDPRYQERKHFDPTAQPVGRRVEVIFHDGELLVGSTVTGYLPERPGFFFTPADPRSNNLRVFAATGAVRAVRYF